VNIALGHLLPEKPAAVVSGINLGHNTSLPYILSSGTVAGALEGAFWGLPALAFSMELPRERLQEIRHTHGKVEGDLNKSLLCAATRAAEFVRTRLEQTHDDPAPVVHNINFPAITTPVTPVAHTQPAQMKLGALFEQQSPACFSFRYMDQAGADPSPDADYNAVMRGCISHSVLDYSFLGA
jgi:5'-nucleotidase